MRLSTEELEHLEFMERTVAPHSADVRSLCATVRRLAAPSPVVEVTEAMVERGCVAGAPIAEGKPVAWPDYYDEDEQAQARRLVRAILTAALERKDHE